MMTRHPFLLVNLGLKITGWWGLTKFKKNLSKGQYYYQKVDGFTKIVKAFGEKNLSEVSSAKATPSWEGYIWSLGWQAFDTKSHEVKPQ